MLVIGLSSCVGVQDREEEKWNSVNIEESNSSVDVDEEMIDEVMEVLEIK